MPHGIGVIRPESPSKSSAADACGIVRHSTLWLMPDAVAQIEFLEWTGPTHLRHTKFVGLRDDKDPRNVVREE
jgi:ATP-dependent DNA ligase